MPTTINVAPGSTGDPAYRRKLGYALLQKGSDTSPVQHWGEAVARAFQGAMGGYDLRKEDEREETEKAAGREAMIKMLGGGGDAAPAPDVPSSPSRPALTAAVAGGNPPPVGSEPPLPAPTAGPRSASFSPVTTLPAPSTATGSMYAGLSGWAPGERPMDAPLRDQPLDVMMPREKVVEALRTATGAPPAMSGATPVGATPVQSSTIAQTQAIMPPAPAAAAPVSAAGGVSPAQRARLIAALQNKYTAPMAQSIITQMATRDFATSDPKWEKLGKDEQGTEVYGWVDPRKRSTTPVPLGPAATPGESVIPPAPPGVDPKVWRKQHSERRTEEAMPADVKVSAALRKEIQDLPSYKNLAQSAPVYKSMSEAAGRDNRAADVNMIYGMAKLMDPGSVVRESEMTIAQAVATLPQNLQAQIKSQLQSTGRLDPAVREAIMQEAHSRVQAYAGMFNQDAKMFRGIAQRGRMNEADVIPDFGTFEPFKAPPISGAPDAKALEDEARRRGLMK